MQRRRVGGSGLQVSRIGLGTMTWGDDTDGDAAADQLRVFVQSGGTLVETADGYGGGAAQDVLAGLLRRVVARDDLVLAGRSLLGEGPHGAGAGRGALLGGAGPAAAPARHRPPRPVAAARLGPRRPARRDARGGRGGGHVRPGALRGARRARRAGSWPRWRSGRARAGRGALPASVQAEYSLLARDAEAELLPGGGAPRRRAAGVGAAGPRGADRPVPGGRPRSISPRTSRNGARSAPPGSCRRC